MSIFGHASGLGINWDLICFIVVGFIVLVVICDKLDGKR